MTLNLTDLEQFYADNPNWEDIAYRLSENALKEYSNLIGVAAWLDEIGQTEAAERVMSIYYQADQLAASFYNLFRANGRNYALLEAANKWSSHDLCEEDFQEVFSKYLAAEK